MTPQVYEYVKALGLKGKVLDVGAYDINGSVRDLFDNYTGVDARVGPNVAFQMNAHHLHFMDESFDHVLCLETLEHDPQFWVTVQEMRRVLRKGGVLVITVPGINFAKHEMPRDYWRFTTEGLKKLFGGMWPIVVTENHRGTGVYGHAVKK